jgi:homoserine O-acetyltransferase
MLERFKEVTSIIFLGLFALSAATAEYPGLKQGDWIERDFKFHTGEIMPELRIHYATIGKPTGQPVLVLHGTGGSLESMLSEAFAGKLFGPGQPLDSDHYYIIIPDGIGHGKSSKPSDGLRGKFPHYDYEDMVSAQYRLVHEGLGITHLRLIIGNSMGGMHTWLWSIKYPDMMDALVPMASQPAPMSGRNWMLRRLLVETVRSDSSYEEGNYTTQPAALKLAAAFYGVATNGGSIALQNMAPTREKADAIIDKMLSAPISADANDFIYAGEASADYNPANLERIKAAVLAINSADDEKNPPETGVVENAMKRVTSGRLLLIPASVETRGHGTTGNASWYSRQLEEFLHFVPVRKM